MGRTCGNCDKVFGQLMSRLGAYAVPRQVPICAEEHFEGVIDLIKMKTFIWDMAAHGTTFTYAEIPAEMADKAAKAREFMVEAAAESSEPLMNKYLDARALSEAAIYADTKSGV